MSEGFVLELKGISKIYNESSSDKLVIFKNINLNIKKSHSIESCLLYTSPSPRDRTRSRMPSSA